MDGAIVRKIEAPSIAGAQVKINSSMAGPAAEIPD
jgi:hypothetical protein